MPIRQRLKADLAAAIRAKDAARVAVLRTLMGAIANAEAVELDPTQPREVQGRAEVPRRRLSADDLSRIVRREADDRWGAADEYERRGRPDEAARLRRDAEVVERYLPRSS